MLLELFDLIALYELINQLLVSSVIHRRIKSLELHSCLVSLSLILILILGSGLILILRILLSLVWHTAFVSQMRALRV